VSVSSKDVRRRQGEEAEGRNVLFRRAGAKLGPEIRMKKKNRAEPQVRAFSAISAVNNS
jgi:hypothetical protein